MLLRSAVAFLDQIPSQSLIKLAMASATPKTWNPKSLAVKMDKSLGIIPCRYKNDAWEVFLIQQRAGHWCFCKGHPEPSDKSEFETACRELEEETNMKVKRVLSDETVAEKYGFEKKGLWKDKTVVYWLAEVQDDSVVKLQDIEVRDSKWMIAEEVEKQMTYFEAKELSKQVAARLATIKA